MTTTKHPDLTGLAFFQLTVLRREPTNRGKAGWLCRCVCGREVVSTTSELKRGHTKSCGCSRQLRHGHARNASTTVEYTAWRSMKNRCDLPSAASFKYYGGRGIVVCDRWRDDFEAFLADVGPRPSSKHSLDRIDPNGNYEPGNVRWATLSEQNQNQRRYVEDAIYERDGQFDASATYDHKMVHLGRFDTREEAIAARRGALAMLKVTGPTSGRSAQLEAACSFALKDCSEAFNGGDFEATCNRVVEHMDVALNGSHS